jgi:4-amino-4-deoxy-L-arabinose transferase-like glycosyltransferase
MTTTASKRNQVSVRAHGLTAIVDYAVSSHGRAVTVLIVAALLAFLPGFFQIPPTDRDEARFAQATKQMLETGEYIDIHFQDEVRYKKPVGIYWLQAAVVKGAEGLGVPNARVTIWLYRLPSLLGAIGAVLLTYWTALAFVSRRAATLAGLLMATSVLLGVEARLAKTDAVLLFTVVAAMGAMARIYLNDGRPPSARNAWMLPAIFWTALAAGILIKGPLILMFAGMTMLALAVVDRSARWLTALRPVPGLIWLCILVLPWFLAIATRSGSNFYSSPLVATCCASSSAFRRRTADRPAPILCCSG